MIYILYSADYELFFGRNYLSEQDVLIEPTDRLLDACRTLGIPMTLFADVMCAWRYRELGEPGFADAMEQQMIGAVQDGHDVQLHVHPHWLTAEKGNGEWIIREEAFLLGGGRTPTECSRLAHSLYEKGRDYLNGLLCPVWTDYQCVAHRAGGYGIQPHEREIVDAMIDAGMVIDSSVVPGLVLGNEANRIDFRRMKPSQGHWLVRGSGLRPHHGCQKGLFEIPVVAYRESLFDVFGRVLRASARRLRGYRPAKPVDCRPRGVSIQKARLMERAAAGQVADGGAKRRSWRRLQRQQFELELTTRVEEMLSTTMIYLKKAAGKSSDTFLSFSCHPKAVFDQDLDALATYHLELKRRLGDSLKAISFRQASELISARPGTG